MSQMENELNQINRSLGTIEGKIDGINKRLDVSNGRISKNECKIADLTSFKDNLVGKISIIVVIVNLIVAVITPFLREMFRV